MKNKLVKRNTFTRYVHLYEFLLKLRVTKGYFYHSAGVNPSNPTGPLIKVEYT